MAAQPSSRSEASLLGFEFLDHRSRKVLLYLFMVGVVAVPVFSLQASGWRLGLSVVAFGFVLSGASLLVGGLIGFLFGIPRRLQSDNSEAGSMAEAGGEAALTRKSLYGANTNLEQISDWLTKILVGVGLTQLTSVGDAISKASAFAQAGLGNLPASGEFGVALTLHFLVSGFLFGYLWTRLYLGRALTAAEQTVQLKKEVDSLREASLANARALELASKQLSVENDPVAQHVLDEAIKRASPDIRAAVYYRAHDQRWRNWRDQSTKPVMERTIPIFRALANSDSARLYHANYGQLGFALKDKRMPDWEAAAEALTNAIQIRGEVDRPDLRIYEFARALCRIHLDENFEQGKPTPAAERELILKDIALGQQWMKESGLDGDETISAWLKLNRGSGGDT